MTQKEFYNIFLEYGDIVSGKIEYDEKDRMAKVQLVGWESTVDQTFTYTDDHIYPDRQNMESEDEGDHFSTVVTYTYKKFDDNGNPIFGFWTKKKKLGDVELPCKAPDGMFEEEFIPNDLNYVIKKMEEYY